MALTRTQCAKLLVRRLKNLLDAANLSTTAVAGNPDVQAAMSYALRELDYAVDDVNTISASEIGEVSADDYGDVFLLAEYRLLEQIQGNLALVDTDVGPRGQKLSQLALQVDRMLHRRQAEVDELVSGPSTGTINLDFATHGDD